MTPGPRTPDASASMNIDADGFRLTQARSPDEFALGRALFEEYAARLGVDLCFQGFAAELGQLGTMYAPPTGCLVLAWDDDRSVGCGAVRRLTGTDCEMKRVYVRDGARGRGYGRRIAAQLIGRARQLGYRRMLLDTLETMRPARALYASLGFRECSAYYENPLSGGNYMELELVPPET